MPLRLLRSDDVRAALPMAAAIDAARVAYVAASSGRGEAPERVHIDLPGDADVALFMPGFLPGDGEGPASLVIKTVTVFPGNADAGRPTIQGALLVLDAVTGAACGLLDAAAVTAVRTAAGSAVATGVLARRDASRLAMLGTGVLAAPHVEAVNIVRPLDEVHVWGRTHAHAEALAERVGGMVSAPVTVHATADDAVAAADIICTATPAERPLFDAASMAPGAHVNAVGAFRPTMCELPAALIGRARVYVDQVAAARVEAGDLIQAERAGRFAWSDGVAEIGAVLEGTAAGRTDDREITVFKSVGLSLQDAAAAGAAMVRAERADIGAVIAWP